MKIIVLLVLTASLFAQDLSVKYLETYGLKWNKPQDDDLYGYIIHYGIRTWQDTTTKIIFSKHDTIITQEESCSIHVEKDSILIYGGYQVYFTMQAMDTAGNVSVNSDTVTLFHKFKGDVFGEPAETKVDYFDQGWFDDFYKINYGKSFRRIDPKKIEPSVTVKFYE